MTIWGLAAIGGCSAGGALSPTGAVMPPAPVVMHTAPSLDQLIEAGWKAAGLKTADRADDGEFLRRVTLDLVGRTPALDETKEFLADTAPNKRARAVDLLLAGHEYAEHWSDLFGDLLFGADLKPNISKQYDPRAWLVRALDTNMRYDRLAHEVLTATGDLHDNGALGFLVARGKGGGGPEAVAGAAARIFLGLQIQCAQCHDHPYDPRWKQEDFYGLVAYFVRTKTKTEKMMGDKSLVVVDTNKGQALMRRPRTELDVVVAPRFLGYAVAERPGETRRQTFARATLASDLFAKSMVARTWAQLFGHGIVDPWDDLGGENDPKHPRVLVAVADSFKNAGYDIKWLLKTLVLSTAYARSSARRPGETDEGNLVATQGFARAGIRPLSPEQLFRSLLNETGAATMARRKQGEEAAQKRLAQALKEYVFVFGDDEMAEANTFDGSVPQALLLLNGELTNNGARVMEEGVLGRILASSRQPAQRLEDMFLAAYARRPSPDERSHFVGFLASRQGARTAYEDLYFALLTSTEAITNH